MPFIVFCFTEILCLIVDVFYFKAAIFHIFYICIVLIGAIFLFFKNKKMAFFAVVSIPAIAAFSTAGYLVDWHLKKLVREAGVACFASRKCDLPKSYLGYRINVVYKADGRAQDMIILDGYNHFFLTFNPITRTFERSEM